MNTCSGTIEIWDQTVGCPECGEELWNYPGIKELGMTVAQYEERFFARHPFSFQDCHDGGDEDPKAWDEEPMRSGQLWWVTYPTRYDERGAYMSYPPSWMSG